MFKHGFPPEWSTFKKLIWLVGSGIAGAASGIWKTVTGTLIHLTDALASPMQKCEVTLEPIQDLHGQDAPYPAGGGYQLFDIDNPLFTAPNTYTLTNFCSKVEDGKLYNGGQQGTSAGGGITVKASEGDYTISFVLNGESCFYEVRAVTLNQDNTFATNTYLYNAQSQQTGAKSVTVSFPSGYTHLYFAAYSATKFGSYETSIQIEKGTTAHSWSPYSNICPITGWTGCEVNRTGKNLYNSETAITGYAINASGVIVEVADGAYSPLIPVEVGEKYTFSAYSGNSNNWTRRLHFYDSDGNWVSQAGYSSNYIPLDSRYEITALVPSGVSYARFSYDYGYSSLRKDYNEQFEKAPSASDYEQYQGTTASVTFPDSAGTVYGGTVDLVSGVLTVTHILMPAQTDWQWQKSTSYPGGYYVTLGSYYKAGVPFTSSHAKTVTSIADYIFGTCYRDGSFNFRIMPEDSTTQDWKDYITAQANNGTPIQICCELAEPITYQLTPQEISTLVGENNVWSDANGDITLIYKAQAE